MSSVSKGPQLRWGLGTRSDPSEARTRLLDAAMHCYVQLGIGKTSMADIAAEAKITRPTVYRYFASHQDILVAVVRREIDSFWVEMNQWLTEKGIEDFGEYIIEALMYTLHNAPDTKTHAFLFVEQVIPIRHEIFLGSGEYILDIAEALRPLFERNQAAGRVGEDVDLLMVCELFNRLAISYVTSPSPFFHAPAEQRRMFETILLPVLKAKPTP